ncbi:Protein mlp1 [Amphichorda felina]
MAAADVDAGYIAGHLGLDEPVITSLTTDPTAELVATLLQAVAAKAHEFDTLYADKLQTDIELENAVRSSESRSQASKATAEKALKELEEARQKLREEENKRQTVENELQNLRAKDAGHDDEIKALHDKIETLQSSNRTNLSIIESNNKRDQTLSEELTKQHQRNVELSREISSLQQAEQNAKGQLSSAKYREESLQQQLDLARRNSEWLETELKTKSDESLKYRKEKGARIAELQRQTEDAKSEIDALKRADQQLRDRLSSMQAKADDALVKLQKQEGTFATTVESYKHELEDQRRLVDMSNQLSKKHQERVRDLESEKERLKDNYEGELHRVRLELEQERQSGSELEEKIRQLEGELDELHVRAEQAPPAPSAPQTPRANGSFMPRASSPFATPGSIRSKSAITATQAIDQLYQVKAQLVSEKRRNQQLSEELDGMMAALEAKAPEIQDLQSEADTLRSEIARMSELSQQSFEERDAARRAARKAESNLATSQSEVKILRNQVRDLGTQTQYLVFNIYALEKGMDKLTEEEKYRLQQLERGEITEGALSDMSDTHQFITERLVVFKDIKSLQEKNEEILRITRELAEQMESEEALAAKHQAKEDHDKVVKLQQELDHMAEEAKSIKNTMESYKMERDMFRRILQQRGAGNDESSLMRASLDGSQRFPLTSIEPAEQVESLNEALRKLQTEYDGFRDAQDGVRQDLRNQIDHLTAEKNSLQTDKIKLQGEVRLESERREMLQSNYVALQSENSELQKRSQALSETAAKQDIRTQQVAEELIEAKGLLDSMRNETANLKAEKKLWNDIHGRMTKDNESLIEEKNRLNNIISTQQSLENERSMSESEARRKAQARVETLERELSDTQRKLNNESEETKKLQLRKEYESKESQKRIDELMASLSQLREDHVSIKTSRDHLQARVDELTVEVRNAEERVGRLQPRPTPRPGTAAEGTQELEAEIQDLNNEVSDLKRELDMAKTHLDNAKAQAEQYKELSQSNEEALEDLRSSQEQYQQEMEGLVEERTAKIKELEQRIEDMSAELSRSNTELSTLRDSQGEVARRFQDEKTILEEEVTRLKEDSARHVEAARFHQQDLRAQADIATKAQHDYEQELVKHAEAAKLVQQLRNDYNTLKSEAASLRTEAESAKVTLAQSEGSWEDQRQRLEQEITELKARREDVNAQNKLLHQQLESLTSQVNSLQQSRGSNDDGDEAMSPIPMGDVSEGLRELNSYLRREKEILEVQYDLKSQESKRLQQQLEYTQSQLDEAKLKLDQERSQAAQSGRTSTTHKDLMEKLNELNLYRESSMTLRNENTRLKDLFTEKSKAVEEIEAKVQPLEAEIDTLKTQKSFLEEEIKQVQEDRDRWQKRTEGILTKYGRVDPAEMDGLKENVAKLEAECSSLKEAEQPLKDQVAELTTTLENERNHWQTTRGKLTEQFKERSRKLTGDKNDAIQRANELQEQLGQKTNELEAAQKEAEESTGQKSELEKQIESFQKQVEELRQQASAQAAQTPQDTQITMSDAPSAEASVSADIVAQLEKQLVDARKELEALNAQKLGAEQQLEMLRSEMEAAVAERDETIRQLQEASAEEGEAQTNGEQPAAAAEPAEAATNGTQDNAPGLSDEERQALEEKIAAAEAKAAEFEQKANEVESKIQQTIKERSDRMKDSLNAKLKEKRAQMDEDFKKKEETLSLKFEQEKAIWRAENPSAQPAAVAKSGDEQPPATPKPEKQDAQEPQTSSAPPDLSQLDDAAVRQFLSTNATVKSIVAANIKRKVEAEQAKANAELESKISAAKDQAQMLEAKKSTLRINMSENKLRAAQAKLGVVETAAKETPQKPVVEVWEVAKKATAAPAASATSTPARPPPLRQPSTSGAPGAPASPAVPTPKPMGTPAAPPQAQGTPQAAPSTPAKPATPFDASTNASNKDAPNPFAPKTETEASTEPAQAQQQPQQQQQQQQQQQPQQGQAQPQVRTGLPMPRGGGRGRGNYVPPGQRASTGGHASGLPQPGRGRGGARGGRGGGNLNPNVSEFQPGTKRPRGDSEAAGGAKRARGSH